ncbi:hypothetical protein F5Y13DRAFT_162583 [Hypoxylon sp. FL1857]|nr:hypothetical protein F5Y13DRAFT_162583 [Hypoxylon sp. FL1857]
MCVFNCCDWRSRSKYCTSTWIILRFLLSTLHEYVLRMTKETGEGIYSASLSILAFHCPNLWNSLPAYSKYPTADLEKCTGRQRLLLASIYLEYLFIRFQAGRGNSRRPLSNVFWCSADPIAQKMITTILDNTTSLRLAECPFRGYSWIMLVYGVPIAYFLVDGLVRGNGGPSQVSRGETIRKVTAFIERLDSIAQLQPEHTDTLQAARKALIFSFDLKVGMLEVPARDGTANIDPAVENNDESSVSALLPFHYDSESTEHFANLRALVNDDIWRL